MWYGVGTKTQQEARQKMEGLPRIVKRHNPDMSSRLLHMTKASLEEALHHKKEIIFIGIGIPKLQGDMFGPVLADKLKATPNFNFMVVGGTESPVNNDNLPQTYELIRKKHPNSFIVGLDAFMSSHHDMGLIRCASRKEIAKYKSGSHPSSCNDAMILAHTVNRDMGCSGFFTLSKRCVQSMVDFAYEHILLSMKSLGLVH